VRFSEDDAKNATGDTSEQSLSDHGRPEFFLPWSLTYTIQRPHLGSRSSLVMPTRHMHLKTSTFSHWPSKEEQSEPCALVPMLTLCADSHVNLAPLLGMVERVHYKSRIQGP
jgi:hypothetical protein